jgi:Domain of unknown function (DUF4129)
MTTSFEKTSWRWQLDQLQQRLGEWIEVKLRSVDVEPSVDPFPSWLAALLVQLCWLVLAGLLLWFGYRVIYPYWKNWLANNKLVKLDLDQSPVQIFTLTELLAKSQQFQREGDYTQATRWLYLAALQRLNDAKLILHQPSLTDREYLKLLDTFPSIRSGDILVSTHEQIHFGDLLITAEDFDRCQQAYQQIESGLGANP